MIGECDEFDILSVVVISGLSLFASQASAFGDMLGGDINNDSVVDLDDLETVKQNLGDKYDNGEEEVDVNLNALFAIRNAMVPQTAGEAPVGDGNAPEATVGVNPEPVTFGLVLIGGCSVMMSLTGRRSREA